MQPAEQIRVLNDLSKADQDIRPFATRLEGGHLTIDKMTTMQVNVGKLCNQTCKHCHVDAGPTRKEIMTKATMQLCLEALDRHAFTTVDITGGAPEMAPDFRWFVEESVKRGKHVIVRCNLTILEANEKYADLPEFYARQGVEVVSSLPSYDKNLTDRQRGSGVFGKSIAALKKLNGVGYGRQPELALNLVYNPNGAYLPGNQDDLEQEFKTRLLADFGVTFNHLYTITNMPIARFFDYLLQSGNLQPYMRKLNQQFNPAALKTVMCRSMVSIDWKGRLFDCDFNQMLELPVVGGMHISQFDGEILTSRKVVVGPHCYGCTAGAGSSCGGAVV